MEQIVNLIGIENVNEAIVLIFLCPVVFFYLSYLVVYFREKKLMASDQRVVYSGQGIGFCGLLFIILLLLKVGVVETTVIGWSWWWITAPLWGPFSLAICIFAIIFFGMSMIFIGSLIIAWLIGVYENRQKAKLTEGKKNKG